MLVYQSIKKWKFSAFRGNGTGTSGGTDDGTGTIGTMDPRTCPFLKPV